MFVTVLKALAVLCSTRAFFLSPEQVLAADAFLLAGLIPWVWCWQVFTLCNDVRAVFAKEPSLLEVTANVKVGVRSLKRTRTNGDIHGAAPARSLATSTGKWATCGACSRCACFCPCRCDCLLGAC